jgi:hypothetical protein
VDTESGGGDDAELRDFDGRTVIGIGGTQPRAVAAEALALAAPIVPSLSPIASAVVAGNTKVLTGPASRRSR